MNDVKFSVRQVLKNPGFAAVAVATLALGIGANTAIFSVIHGVLLHPLPYPDPDRLVTVWERDPQRGIEQDRVSGPDYLDWRAQNTVFSDLAVSPGWQGSTEFNLLLPGETVKVQGSYTSASFFSTLGVKPRLGRTFSTEEDHKGGAREAVLSYGLWQRYFGGNPAVIGQTLSVDTYGRRDYTIVGVMPPGFGLPSPCELWLPLGWMGVTLDERRSAHWHNVIARLKPGVSVATAQKQLTTIQARLKQMEPGSAIGSEVLIVPLLEQALGRNFQTALWLLWAVVSAVLLIACANVANLMLARGAAREKELAVRLALGATRWRVMRQLLIESAVLSGLGGLLGVLLGWWGLRLLPGLAPVNIPRLNSVTLDLTALAFTAGISLLTGLLFGLAPAWHCSRADLNNALKNTTPGASPGLSMGRTRNALVIAEVALSLVLLVGAGLMLQSFGRMLAVNRGFNPEHLVTADLDFSVSGFTTWVRPAATRPQVAVQQLLEQLRAAPGVEVAGAASRLIRRENAPPSQPFTIFGRPVGPTEALATAEFKGITPGWLEAMGIRLLRGRTFTEADRVDAAGVAMINETFARRFFPNGDALGQHLKLDRQELPLDATDQYGIALWYEIVGIVGDVKSLNPHPESVPEVYRPYWQWPMQSPTVVVRGRGDPAVLVAAVRRETRAVIPNLPAPVIRTMDQLISESVAQPRLQTVLLTVFGITAVALAAVGLYGVLAYAVTQRTHELGVRMALGAQKRDVLSLVVRHGIKLTLAGIAIGVGLALAFARVIRSLLYQVTPTDPWTISGVAVLLIVMALLASWLPARRAANVEPMEALRHE